MADKLRNLRCHVAFETTTRSRFPVVSVKVDETVEQFAERVKQTILGLAARPNWDGYE